MGFDSSAVIPAKAGIALRFCRAAPVFAGMTRSVVSTFDGFLLFCRHPCEGRDRSSILQSDSCLRRNDEVGCFGFRWVSALLPSSLRRQGSHFDFAERLLPSKE